MPGMSGPPPDLFAALPEQYFTRIVAAAAAARALPGPRLIDLGRGNPDLPPPAGGARGAAGRARGLGRHARLPALPGPRRAARGDRRALPRRSRRGARSRARGRRRAGDQDRDHARRAGLRGRRPGGRAARTPATRTTSPPSRWRARARWRCRSTPPPAGSPTSARWATSAQRSWSSTTPPTRARRARRRGPSRPPSPGRTSAAAWLLNDLAYAFLAFDGRRARSVLEVDGAREVAVELWSPSKVYGMAGWRVGFAVGNAELVGRIRELLDHLAAGVPVALQHGLVAALSGDQGHVRERFEVYRRRREVLVEGLGRRARRRAPSTPGGGCPTGSRAERLLARAARRGRARRGLRRARRRLRAPVAGARRRRPRRRRARRAGRRRSANARRT